MKFQKFEKHLYVKFVLLIIFLAGIILLGIEFSPWLLEKIKNPESFRNYLRSYENYGMLVYILMQAIHVLFVVIPGDLFNICGGYIYGIPLGFTLSMMGIMLGTICTFYISRVLGCELVSKIIPPDKIDKISRILNSSKGSLGILIVCLIPGIPKDLLIYVAGLTPIKASKLFLIYGISRIPGTIIWVSVGSQLYNQNMTGMILTLTGVAVLVVLGCVLKKRYGTLEPEVRMQKSMNI